MSSRQFDFRSPATAESAAARDVAGQAVEAHDGTPLAELVLDLSEPTMVDCDGRRCATAHAVLSFDAGNEGLAPVRSVPFRFTEPAAAVVPSDLGWYFSDYRRWPIGKYAQRARQVETGLAQRGEVLFAGALGSDAAALPLAAWRGVSPEVPRRFSVRVVEKPLPGASAATQQAAREAAVRLLALPWELLREDVRYWLNSVQMRRAAPQTAAPADGLRHAPLRILLVSPRPEDKRAGFAAYRPRPSAFVDGLAALGQLVEVHLLEVPTFPALEGELARARDAGQPYHVVHFDGYGAYDRRAATAFRRRGLGALVFEHAGDSGKSERRRCDLVDAGRVGQALREHQVPLVMLDACQPVQAEQDPTVSVAWNLLLAGVRNVVTLSWSVQPGTAGCFYETFFRELLDGRRVGEAMFTAQQGLQTMRREMRTLAGAIELHDWFVPTLYQSAADAALFYRCPKLIVQQLGGRRPFPLGDLPLPPRHRFVGRNRELRIAQRLLAGTAEDAPRYLVVRGACGEGKTTFAAELARWLVASGRFARAAFVSLEDLADAQSVLWKIGEQLAPDFLARAAREPEKAQHYAAVALAEQATLLVFDGCNAVLPASSRWTPTSVVALGGGGAERRRWSREQAGSRSGAHGVCDAGHVAEIFGLVQQLSGVGQTRAVLTSRQALPEPFDRQTLTLGGLAAGEASDLIGRVLGEVGQVPVAAGELEDEESVGALVGAADGHAQALVLLAGELRRRGLRQTVADLGRILNELPPREASEGERERVLLAAVDLVLQRLRGEWREKISPLAVLHGGGNLAAIAKFLALDVEHDEEDAIVGALVDLGLAELQAHRYVRLNPALLLALRAAARHPESAAAEAAWAQVMIDFAIALEEHLVEDAQLALTLARLDMANLLAALDLCRRAVEAAQTERSGVAPPWSVHTVRRMASALEGLLPSVRRLRELAHAAVTRRDRELAPDSQREPIRLLQPPARTGEVRRLYTPVLDAASPAAGGDPAPASTGAVLRHPAAPIEASPAGQRTAVPLRPLEVRRRAKKKSKENKWNRPRYLALSVVVSRLLDGGRHAEAVQVAERLLERAQRAGELAYAGAAYDIAVGSFCLARALRLSGDPAEALNVLAEAERGFRQRAEAGDEGAARMVAACRIERASCLRYLGRIEAATATVR